MKLGNFMSKEVRIASPAQSICEAAKMMKEIDAGFLPVGENDRLVGMITDRDIAVRAVAAGRSPDTPVRDIMSKEVLYCFEDEEIGAAAHKMSEMQIRRMPVLNRDKHLVGIISLGDIARAGTEGKSCCGAALSDISVHGGQHVQH
ncbi:CBS domain-containing protein [Beijerinckia indica]|uniref:CBS domain containing protein n=1 Tax=Beijerinckia indica subsp. indica (strain ATCC 9039 / DSM 1715 / NCIMB 8712) TaxID=395963 RepID=B2II94_BEII9|nr:CBS domain-containing protein [Beijerinckia indica]ACB96048.1 CBS domain containing protein [Beijerinckia indica subsp. indica ATCC 9039]